MESRLSDAVGAAADEPAPELDELKRQVADLTRQLEATRAENALLTRALEDKTAEATGLERERADLRAQLVQAHIDRAADLIGLEEADRQRNLAVMAEREQTQRDVAALAAERDMAVVNLRDNLLDLVTLNAQAMVDRLELPWDGMAALPAQLDALLARLKAAEGGR